MKLDTFAVAPADVVFWTVEEILFYLRDSISPDSLIDLWTTAKGDVEIGVAELWTDIPFCAQVELVYAIREYDRDCDTVYSPLDDDDDSDWEDDYEHYGDR